MTLLLAGVAWGREWRGRVESDSAAESRKAVEAVEKARTSETGRDAAAEWNAPIGSASTICIDWC